MDQHQRSISLIQNTESSKQCYYATNVSNKSMRKKVGAINKRNNTKHENAKSTYKG